MRFSRVCRVDMRWLGLGRGCIAVYFCVREAMRSSGVIASQPFALLGKEGHARIMRALVSIGWFGGHVRVGI